MLPDALGKLLQLAWLEGLPGVGGGLVDGVDGERLEWAAVLHGALLWAWLCCMCRRGAALSLRSMGGRTWDQPRVCRAGSNTSANPCCRRLRSHSLAKRSCCSCSCVW